MTAHNMEKYKYTNIKDEDFSLVILVFLKDILLLRCTVFVQMEKLHK